MFITLANIKDLWLVLDLNVDCNCIKVAFMRPRQLKG